MKSTLIRLASGLIACLALAAVPVTAYAGFVTDKEPNNTLDTAQVIPSSAFTLDFSLGIGTGGGNAFHNTSTTIPHATILRPGEDQTTANLDYFKFTTYAMGTIVLDITNAPGDPTPVVTNFDTVLDLFTSSGFLLATNDNKGPNGLVPTDFQNGALIGGQLNSHIEEKLRAGTYVVAVSESPSTASNGGTVFGQIPIGGAYTLNISGEGTPAVATKEPATWILLGLGMACTLGYRTWRKRRKVEESEAVPMQRIANPRFPARVSPRDSVPQRTQADCENISAMG